MMVGLLSVYWSGSNAFAKLAANAEAQYSARSAMQQIGEDIRRASAVEVQGDGIILSLSTPGESVGYYRANNQLYRVVTTSTGTATVPIAENVSQLSFGTGATMVTINIDITVGGLTYQLSTTVNPRLIETSG
jgi:Tfp pilus assembly protein PilW